VDAVLVQTQRGNIPPHTHTNPDDSRSPIKVDAKKRRPSIKNIFRPTSGNWHDLVRATPPPSPLATTTSQMSAAADDDNDDDLAIPPVPPTPPRNSLSRPPSLPALARLKMSKTAGYASLGVESPSGSPTRPAARRGTVGASESPSMSPVPGTPGSMDGGDANATLRLKSRVKGLGLGHPSENSPSRASSSPARTTHAPTAATGAGNGDLLVPLAEAQTPRSRSEGGALDDGTTGPIIALTPENLPVLLDYVKQCERRLAEWRSKAGIGLEDQTAFVHRAAGGVGVGVGVNGDTGGGAVTRGGVF
jgi:hypothetical protein